MFVELNFKSGKPAYLQIVDQVKYGVAAGTLRAGDQLPSIRELAERLRINRNTVAKAYAELEHEGIVELVQGKGVFIARQGSPYNKRTRDSILVEAVDAAIVQAHHFRVARKELLDLVRERLDEFEKRREEEQ
jgi:GntR family transcriptional regulator